MLVLASLGVALAAPCATPTSVPALRDAIDRANGAYASLDLPGFETAVESARSTLVCLDAVVPPSLAAGLHRTEGLAAFIASDPVRASAAFGAARRLEPTWRFPADAIPEGNPVLDAYGALDVAALGFVEVDPPPSGTLRIDGQPTRRRPTDVPIVYQWLDRDGAVATTAYLWPEDPLPAADVPLGSAAATHPRRGAMLIVSGATALASGALYGSAALTHRTWADPATDRGKLDGLRATNNGLVIASGLALGVSLGTGTVAWVVL
jgi:hypothetical protein